MVKVNDPLLDFIDEVLVGIEGCDSRIYRCPPKKGIYRWAEIGRDVLVGKQTEPEAIDGIEFRATRAGEDCSVEANAFRRGENQEHRQPPVALGPITISDKSEESKKRLINYVEDTLKEAKRIFSR